MVYAITDANGLPIMVYAITDANGLPIMVYAIADANECLVITGSGIEDVKITKKTWVWPFQRYSRISVLPTDYSIDLHAITMEKLQFALLMVFTIGPSNDFEALKKYAMLLANVKELRDAPDSEYFAFLSRKAHEGASNQARIDVAEARMRGEIGESEKTETELKRLRATNVTKPKIAKEVAQQKADAAYHTELEGADGAMYAQSKNAEIAAFRQTNEAESTFYHQVKEADASFYTRQKQAEADAYVKQKKAEGIAAKAKAKAYGALADVPGGPQGLIQYLMLENDTYVELANANGEAIRGLQPKISVWNNMKAPPMGLTMERPALDNRPSRLIRRPALLKRDPDKNEASVRKIPNMVLLRLLKKAHFLELHLSPEHSGEDERLDELLIPRRAEDFYHRIPILTSLLRYRFGLILMAILYMIPTTFALPTSPPPDNGQSNDSPFEKYKDGIITKFWALAASLCDNIVPLFIIVMGFYTSWICYKRGYGGKLSMGMIAVTGAIIAFLPDTRTNEEHFKSVVAVGVAFCVGSCRRVVEKYRFGKIFCLITIFLALIISVAFVKFDLVPVKEGTRNFLDTWWIVVLCTWGSFQLCDILVSITYAVLGHNGNRNPLLPQHQGHVQPQAHHAQQAQHAHQAI